MQKNHTLKTNKYTEMTDEYLFPNGQRTFTQRLSFPVLAAFSIENSQVVQRGSYLHCQ